MNVTPLMSRSIYSINQGKACSWQTKIVPLDTSDLLTEICMPSGANPTICSSLFRELCLLGEPGGAEGVLWHKNHYIIKHLKEQIPSSIAQRTIHTLELCCRQSIQCPVLTTLVAKVLLEPCSLNVMLAQNRRNFAETTATAILS